MSFSQKHNNMFNNVKFVNVSFTSDHHQAVISVHGHVLWRSVEIPTRCSFVTEFIVPKFIEGSNMCRAAHRSSSGALNCICGHWFTCPYGDRPLPRLSGKFYYKAASCWYFYWIIYDARIHFPLSLGNGRSPHGYINQRLQVQFRAPDDERCAARNMLEPSINFGTINSVTKLHLVGISTERHKTCPCTEMPAWWWSLVNETFTNFTLLNILLCFWLNDILVSTTTQQDGSNKKN
jgi:hypothetical protein